MLELCIDGKNHGVQGHDELQGHPIQASPEHARRMAAEAGPNKGEGDKATIATIPFRDALDATVLL